MSSMCLNSLFTIAVAGLGLSGCGQPDGMPTPRASAQARSSALGPANPVDAEAQRRRDAALVAQIEAELDRGGLDVRAIDIDASNGRVVLRGTAADAAARERATRLVRQVAGVVGVDNLLQLHA